MGKAKTTARTWLTAVLTVCAVSIGYHPWAYGDPASRVYSPVVVKGEWELESNGGYQHCRNEEGDHERQLVGEIGYGLASWWKTELATGYTRIPGDRWIHDETEWENIFVLTEPGMYWLDSALFVEYARDHAGGRNLLEMGPLLQKEFGPIQANLNVLLVRELGRSGEPGLGVEYAGQLKWRGNPYFEPGVQTFGGLGRTNHFGQDTDNRLGPAFFGQVRTGDRQKLKYDAAVLFGTNRNAADTTFRFTLEYEFY